MTHCPFCDDTGFRHVRTTEAGYMFTERCICVDHNPVLVARRRRDDAYRAARNRKPKPTRGKRAGAHR